MLPGTSEVIDVSQRECYVFNVMLFSVEGFAKKKRKRCRIY